MRTLHMLHKLEVAPGDTGSTVRNGFKWADLKKGEYIELCVCTPVSTNEANGLPVDFNAEHNVEGRGIVDKLWFGYFRDIPAWYISFEHELRSRIYWGLFDSMRYAYGRDFGEHSPVTVILYTRIK